MSESKTAEWRPQQEVEEPLEDLQGIRFSRIPPQDMLSMMSALNRKPPFNFEITVAFSEDEKRQRRKNTESMSVIKDGDSHCSSPTLQTPRNGTEGQAKPTLPPGDETVLIGMGNVMMESSRQQACVFCGAQGEMRCSVCKAWYCSMVCQVDDWYLHKNTCRSPPVLDVPQKVKSNLRYGTGGDVSTRDSSAVKVSTSTPLSSSSIADRLERDIGGMTQKNITGRMTQEKDIAGRMGDEMGLCSGQKSCMEPAVRSMGSMPSRLDKSLAEISKDCNNVESNASANDLKCLPKIPTPEKSAVPPSAVARTPGESASNEESASALPDTTNSSIASESQQNFGSLLEVGEIYNGFISLSASYEQFTAVIVVEAVSCIFNEAHEILSTAPAGVDFKPQIGSLVAAYSPTEETWYRARVLEVEGSTYNVCYVDFGNKEAVKQVKPVPEGPFSDLPELAFLARLHSKIEDQVQDKLKRMVQVDNTLKFKVIAKKGLYTKVALCEDQDESNTIVAEYILGPLLQATASPVPPAASSPKPEAAVSPAVRENTDPDCAAPAATRPKEASPSQREADVRRNDSQKENGVIISPDKGSPEECDDGHSSSRNVSCKLASSEADKSPSCYVIAMNTVDLLLQLEEMSVEINQQCEGSPTSTFRPRRGEACLAKFVKGDGRWYRALCVAADTTHCQVIFVDYGNTDKVCHTNIRPIPRQFLGLPCLALYLPQQECVFRCQQPIISGPVQCAQRTLDMAVQVQAVRYRALAVWWRGGAVAAMGSAGNQQHCRRNFSSSQRCSGSKWRYEADRLVKLMAHKVEIGFYNSVSGLTLNTARPLTPDLFEEALMHLQKKVEFLQVCLPQRDGRMWVADMDTMAKIDFQVLRDGSLWDVVKSRENAAYNVAEGPLWAARLVVCPPEEPCKLPQVKDAFPYQYHLVFNCNHTVTDGISIMSMQQVFFTLLDDMLDGAQVNDKPIGELRDRNEDRVIEAKIRETLEKDPQRLKALLEEVSKHKTRVPLITEAFGEPQEPYPDTVALPMKILDHKLLQVFIAKCKAHKVTFSSGFGGLMNAALVELVREAGVVRDSYTISTCHSVDTRRYKSDVKSIVWGYHACNMTHTMETPCNVRKNFWKYVVEYDTKFRNHLNTNGPLQDRMLDHMMLAAMPDRKQKVIYDFFYVNIYSPRTESFGNGKHIQLTDFCTCSPLTKTDFGMTNVVVRFRDQVMIQPHISSGFITEANAVKFIDKVTGMLYDISKTTH
ncbi:Tudor domain-containing protein 1 [Portunus trituberculatus]|uniref:Tudor domain-containing protein 1 n=1 Tax=Portunus trituberculatus TaxID=210409 RepID=A0A5B7DP70_PORTR|nr:Tudor domain-containing protein 1 [Portunus trituberculatus]